MLQAMQLGISLGVSVFSPGCIAVTEFAGWDTQLIARRAGSSAPLEIDTQVADSHKEYLLLWRNSEKPKEPFNLTPYAITLVSSNLIEGVKLTNRTTFQVAWSGISLPPIVGCVLIREPSRMQNMIELKRRSIHIVKADRAD